jgi:bacillithiol biosynthesis cysteine-adding enzyme BshC
LQHTEFTDRLKEEVDECLESSTSYTDFFAALMHRLFAKHGLLLIDSADQGLKLLGRQTLQSIIRHYEQIDHHVREQIDRIEQQGFPAQVQVGEFPALLFIEEEQERRLLEKRGERFHTKDNRFQYTEAELLSLAQQEPWRFSNNVITRPLMQETLFPTLGFVGGPGEIAYWALYRSYFEYMGLTLPIIYPRVSMTLVEKPIAKIMEKREVPLSAVFDDLERYKREWLEAQVELDLEGLFNEARQGIKSIYEPLLQKIDHIPGMDQLGEKNLEKIMEQVTFLEKRALAGVKAQHEAALRQFDKLQQALYPYQKPQERLHNAFTFLNKHGMVLVDHLLETAFPVNGKHKVVYL